jgi:hypothetical protein
MAIKPTEQIWKDYWLIFDVVCESLISRELIEIVDKLKDAQLYVNGLTDGWFEFYTRLESIIDVDKGLFNDYELEQSFKFKRLLAQRAS